MSRVGQVFENPPTGERAVILTDPLEHWWQVGEKEASVMVEVDPPTGA